MLQHHLLFQLHKYISLCISDDGEPTVLEDPRARAEERFEAGWTDGLALAAEEEELPDVGDPATWDSKFPPVRTCQEEEMAMGIMGERVRMGES